MDVSDIFYIARSHFFVIYSQMIDDIINGSYDSTKDILETYSDAWDETVEQSTEVVPGEGEKDKPTDGDDDGKDDPEGGGGGGGGNRWWEAKSGNYWNMLMENLEALAKFKSDMGARLRIAIEHGATYELFSNTPIPEDIKEWLIEKGIPFTELLD